MGDVAKILKYDIDMEMICIKTSMQQYDLDCMINILTYFISIIANTLFDVIVLKEVSWSKTNLPTLSQFLEMANKNSTDEI